MSYTARSLPVLFVCALALATCGPNRPAAVAWFTESTDIGSSPLSGSYEFDASTDEYRITGSGENMWNEKDAFFYAWRKAAGDLVLTADVELVGEGKNAHRKAGWVVRGGLEPGDPYADFMVHGDGLISQQYRQVAGGPTLGVQAAVTAPASLRLERTGNLFSLYVSKDSGVFEPVGAVTVELPDEVYAGLGVCSHDESVTETAIFRNVGFQAAPAAGERVLESTLEIFNTTTGRRRVVHQEMKRFEAPNWSRDGSTLLFNSEGRLYTLPVGGGEPKLLDTGVADRCNNDHGYSPDGTQLAISHNAGDGSLVYTLPSTGGTPKLITPEAPSYWHGWSPDGGTLAYCARRNGNFDIYTVPVAGGKETRLTTADGLDDGPDYSPDGQYIYFNSIRTGQMKIWRMNADGSGQTQWTPDDDYGDWFAHPSPDGRTLVYIAFDKSVEGHPQNKNVVLRLMPAAGGVPKTVATLFGGQGTINVPSWSPDSKEFAFVSYRLVLPPS
jgi:TolB protein